MPLSQSLLDEMHAKAKYLFDVYGCKVRKSTYDFHSFGDSTLILAVPEFDMRLVRDRGEILVDFFPAADPNERWRLEDLYRFIHKRRMDNATSLDAVLTVLKGDFREFQRLLSVDYQRLEGEGP